MYRHKCSASISIASSPPLLIISRFPALAFCLPQEESLHLVFRSLPPGSSGTVDEVTKVIGNALDEHGVEVGGLRWVRDPSLYIFRDFPFSKETAYIQKDRLLCIFSLHHERYL